MISSTVFYQRKKQSMSAKLSLVSLMDIFTILVFFLLLNSGEAQKIENAKFVKLPDSTKGAVPHEQLLIHVNKDEIWLETDKIADVADVLSGPEDIIEPLAEKLQEFREKLPELTPFQEQNGLAVVILGDKEVPFVLLKSVMATCRAYEFRNVSLAVNRVVGTGVSSATTPVQGG